MAERFPGNDNISSKSSQTHGAGDEIKPRLLDQIRNCIRRMVYNIRTEELYIGWIRRYIYFKGKRHPHYPTPAHFRRRTAAMWLVQ